MLEPAAFGAAVMFGPNTWNFREIVRGLHKADAAITLKSPEQMAETLTFLLTNDAERQRCGVAAQAFVRQHRGAIRKTLQLLNSAAPLQSRAA